MRRNAAKGVLSIFQRNKNKKEKVSPKESGPIPLSRSPESDSEESKMIRARREAELPRLAAINEIKKAYMVRRALKNKLDCRSRREMVGTVTRGFLEE